MPTTECPEVVLKVPSELRLAADGALSESVPEAQGPASSAGGWTRHPEQLQPQSSPSHHPTAQESVRSNSIPALFRVSFLQSLQTYIKLLLSFASTADCMSKKAELPLTPSPQW